MVRSGWHWAASQCLFHSQTHFLTTPLCSLSTAQTLEQKQPGEPPCGLLSETAALTQVLLLSAQRLRQRLREPHRLGWVSRHAHRACLVSLGSVLSPAALGALTAQSFASSFPAPLPSCLRELAWKLSGPESVILCSH